MTYDRTHACGGFGAGLVESTIKLVAGKRMVTHQQRRWSQRGAHLLLHVRTRTLDDIQRENVVRWYPRMARRTKGSALHVTRLHRPQVGMVSIMTKNISCELRWTRTPTASTETTSPSGL